jgi:hypothetical protein
VSHKVKRGAFLPIVREAGIIAIAIRLASGRILVLDDNLTTFEEEEAARIGRVALDDGEMVRIVNRGELQPAWLSELPHSL